MTRPPPEFPLHSEATEQLIRLNAGGINQAAIGLARRIRLNRERNIPDHEIHKNVLERIMEGLPPEVEQSVWDKAIDLLDKTKDPRFKDGPGR